MHIIHISNLFVFHLLACLPHHQDYHEVSQRCFYCHSTCFSSECPATMPLEFSKGVLSLLLAQIHVGKPPLKALLANIRLHLLQEHMPPLRLSRIPCTSDIFTSHQLQVYVVYCRGFHLNKLICRSFEL